MKKYFLGTIFSVATIFVSAQGSPQKYLTKLNADSIKKHVYVLASDSLEGRETGREGQRKAANYIAKQFESYGLKPAAPNFKQPFNIREGEDFIASLTINGEEKVMYEDFYFLYTLKNAVNIKDSNIVFLGYGIESENYNDYQNAPNIKGKIVLMLMGEPKNKKGIFYTTGTDKASEYTTKMNLRVNKAKEKGAAGVILVNESFNEWSKRIKRFFSMPGASLAEADDDTFFAMHISSQFATELFATNKINSKKLLKNYSKGKTSSQSINLKFSIEAKREYKELATSNVIGIIEGKKYPNEYIVISSHYDHIGLIDDEINYGADDNASGTSTVMELARIFSEAVKNGETPDRSIVFTCFSGEEKGLLGSKWYTDFSPIFPLENTVANLNIDMVGRYDSKYEGNDKYVYVIGSDKLSSDLHNLSEYNNEKYAGLTLDYVYNRDNDPNRFYYRSDHYNFAKNNIPVIFYFNGTHPDYHKPGDTPDKIVVNKIANISKLIFATAWDLANRPERIKVDKLEKEN